MRLHFLGANRQVTGSRYLLEAGGLRLMIDCGLFQERPFLGRNWEPSPVPPDSIHFLLLTHAHLDHCGLIPKLVREGFHGPIITTSASADLARIVMLDAARIQEEDAATKRARHQREGRPNPQRDVPLYDVNDANRALPLFRRVAYDQDIELNDRVTVCYREAGHVLGSASLEVTVREGGTRRCILFSGDVGLWDRPLIRDPLPAAPCDYVVMESTYGDRNHEGVGEVEENLARVINATIAARGNLVIPTFAIERAQELMFYLSRLTRAKRIPSTLVFLDSPMAIDATAVFRAHPECLDEETRAMLQNHNSPFEFPGFTPVRTRTQSQAINSLRGTAVIMAGSGMCTGGRIKHHLIHNLTRPESTILFVGYQARGTLGREIASGAPRVRIFNQFIDVRARVEQLHGLSAHADHDNLLRWCGALPNPPRQLFLTHGEEEVALKLADEIRATRQWNVAVPEYQEIFELA